MSRIGIAGIGAVAETYLSLMADGGIAGTPAALCSRNESRMADIAGKYGMENVPRFTDYREMLDSGLIDIAMICTPHFQHPAMAAEAIKRGIHTLVEKPLGVYGEEAQALLPLAADHPEAACGVLYCRRMNPVFQKIRELTDSIGALKRATWIVTDLYRTKAYHRSSPWRGTWRGEGGGLLMTQASHQLDLFLWLCGMPERVRAFCGSLERPIEVENDAMLEFSFPGGFSGQFIASSREFPGTNRLELSGSRGQIVLEKESALTVTSLGMDEREFSETSERFFGPIPSTQKTFSFPESDTRALQAAVVNDFIQAAEQGRQPVCPLEQALRSLTAVNAAYLSWWNGTEISIPFPGGRFTEELNRRISCPSGKEQR